MTSVYINRPSSTRFVARVRAMGHRKYKCIGKPTVSHAVAIRRMAKEFSSSNRWKRGDVLIIADYYDPQQLCELVRR